MKKTSYFSIACLLFVVLFSCRKDKEVPNSEITTTINGSAQKGPFTSGSSITIYELGANYAQTGRSYNTQINDNSGSFQLKNISLVSNYVYLRADGFYFNEVCGSNSSSQITLNCISDISKSGSLNVNLLTHLEKPRVEYLLTQGMTFDAAKAKAQKEVLDIFNISLTSIPSSEKLDITQTGEGNAVLLAISSILQGFRTESELTSLLSLISTDISADGILDNVTAKSSIIDHALLLDTNTIRSNVSTFYSNLGITASIPGFEKYIKQFTTTSNYIVTNSVMYYPAAGLFGDNVLLKNQVTYIGTSTSFAGQSKKCCSLMIRMRLISGNVWGWQSGTNQNLNISQYDFIKNEQYFTVINTALPFDLHLNFQAGGTYIVEYFEINSTTPTFSKTIVVS